MPSIRHHLTMAEAAMTGARAHLESAFQHTIDEGYDPRWAAAIDLAVSQTTHTIAQVDNIKTLIEPPAPPQE